MTKQFSNYSDLLTFTRASKGHALRPVSYGDELVTNGTFDSDTSGWTSSSAFTATLNQSAGELSVTSTGNYGRALQAITCEIGKIYSLTCDVTEVGTTALVVVAIASSGTVNNAVFLKNDITSTQTVTAIFVATQQTHYVSVGNQDVNTGVTSKFDNISVKEVLFDQPDGTLTLFEHPENIPRVEYDADGNRLGLLVEESRTNLITHSENFSNSSWNSNKQGISVSRDVAVAPDGTLTADKLNETATTDTHRVGFNISSVGDAVFSFFAKAGERTFVRTWAFVGGNTAGAEFNLSTGAIVREHTSGAATIKNVGNGWYRCSCIVDAASANSVVVGPVTEAVSGNANYAGEAGKGIYIWGAQLEEASFPTSYMKNEGSPSGKTRSADVASIPVADFGYNQSAGTVVFEASVLNDQNANDRRILEISDGTTSNFFSFYQDVSAGENISIANQSGGSLTANFDTGFTLTAGVSFKAIATLKDNDVAASVNGGSITTDTSTTISSALSEVNVGYLGGGTQQLNGHIKSIKYYPRRLTNAQLQDITS